MADATHQNFTTSVDIPYNVNQLITARRLVDQLYQQNNMEWYSSLLLETADFSDSNCINNDFLQYAGKDKCSFEICYKYT